MWVRKARAISSLPLTLVSAVENPFVLAMPSMCGVACNLKVGIYDLLLGIARGFVRAQLRLK